MKTDTQIEKQLRRKTNPILIDTILAAKKNKNWQKIASKIATPRKNHIIVNLKEINEIIKKGDYKTILIPGKVLSEGELNKKVKVVALNFSKKARDKLKNAGIDFKIMIDEIKSNPEAKGIKIIGEK